jgi:hypothetical protein
LVCCYYYIKRQKERAKTMFNIASLPRKSKISAFIGDRLKQGLTRGITAVVLATMLSVAPTANANAFSIVDALQSTLNAKSAGAIAGAFLGNDSNSDMERALKVGAGIMVGSVIDEALKKDHHASPQSHVHQRHPRDTQWDSHRVDSRNATHHMGSWGEPSRDNRVDTHRESRFFSETIRGKDGEITSQRVIEDVHTNERGARYGFLGGRHDDLVKSSRSTENDRNFVNAHFQVEVKDAPVAKRPENAKVCIIDKVTNTTIPLRDGIVALPDGRCAKVMTIEPVKTVQSESPVVDTDSNPVAPGR